MAQRASALVRVSSESPEDGDSNPPRQRFNDVDRMNHCRRQTAKRRSIPEGLRHS